MPDRDLPLHTLLYFRRADRLHLLVRRTPMWHFLFANGSCKLTGLQSMRSGAELRVGQHARDNSVHVIPANLAVRTT